MSRNTRSIGFFLCHLSFPKIPEKKCEQKKDDRNRVKGQLLLFSPFFVWNWLFATIEPSASWKFYCLSFYMFVSLEENP